jgi:membrane protease YdiL (CAAX protease family)
MGAILAFILTCYGLSIALSLLVGLTGGHASFLIGLSYLSMFLPAAAVFLVNATMNEPVRINWTSFPIKYLPIALFLIPGLLHAVMLPAMALLGASVQWLAWLTPHADGLYYVSTPPGWGTLTLPGLVERILVNATFGVMIVSFFAFFEEIGWRAWLLPRLAQRVGARRGVVFTSIIWAIWHVPFELSGIQHIDGVSPVRLALSLPLGILATGLILGWLWLRTESIWLVAICHGASNNWGQYAFKYMQDSGRPEREMIALDLGSLALLCAGLILLWRMADFRPDAVTASPGTAARKSCPEDREC